jgi:hypothetical protein
MGSTRRRFTDEYKQHAVRLVPWAAPVCVNPGSSPSRNHCWWTSLVVERRVPSQLTRRSCGRFRRLAGGAQRVESLLAGEFPVSHRDAHRDPDLPVGLQCTSQMIGRVMSGRGEQRHRRVRGAHRPGCCRLIGERTGAGGIKVRAARFSSVRNNRKLSMLRAGL